MHRIPEEVDTPDVLIDRDVLERNIARMAAAVRDPDPVMFMEHKAL